MFIMTETGALINLDNVQAITYQKAYKRSYKYKLGTTLTWEQKDGYEVVAEANHKCYVIQSVSSPLKALNCLDEIAQKIRVMGGIDIVVLPDDEDE